MVVEESQSGRIQFPADALSTSDRPPSSLRQSTSAQEVQLRVPGGGVGWDRSTAPPTASPSQEQETRRSGCVDNGVAELQSDISPGHSPSRNSRLPVTESYQNIASTSSTTSTCAGDQPRPVESLDLPNPLPHSSQFAGTVPPPPSGSRGSGSAQDSRLQVTRHSRSGENERDAIDPGGPSTTPRSPPRAPPNFSHPHRGHDDPTPPGPSNNDRRQRNQPQDKVLLDLGEGVSKMNSNLEALNSNLSALNNFVKASHVPRKKQESRSTKAQPSDDDGTDADDEEAVDRQYRPPKRKTRKQNVLHKLVRAHARKLLGINAGGSLHCDVTPEEADGFDDSAGYPCTTEKFRLHLTGTPAHKWNRAAAEVFTKSFLQGHPDFNHDQTKKYFITHLRSLTAAFKKQQQLEGMAQKERDKAKDDTAAQTRRSTRKHNLYHIRIEAVKTISELKRFEPLIVALGTAGMSSDETDGEPGVKTIKTCLIRRPYWRAPEVGLFLHTIDSVSAHVKVHEIKPGGQRRKRETRRGLVSHRGGVVNGLPKNFYTAEILNEGPGVYDKIRPQDEVDITHTTEIMERAMQPPDRTTVN